MSEFGEHDIDPIEHWLDGTLGKDEVARLQARMEADPGFRRQVEMLAELKRGIERAGRKELLEEIGTWEEKEKPVGPAVIALWRQPWVRGIAAALVMGALAALFWPRPDDPQELFARYFEPYPNVIMPTVRGDMSADSSMIAKGFKAYDRGAYEEAVSYFEQVDDERSVLLYLGNAYLALDEADKAIPLFEKLIREYDVFDEQAEWYLGLGLLKLKKVEESTTRLRAISKSKSSYRKRSDEILNELK